MTPPKAALTADERLDRLERALASVALSVRATHFQTALHDPDVMALVVAYTAGDMHDVARRRAEARAIYQEEVANA